MTEPPTPPEPTPAPPAPAPAPPAPKPTPPAPPAPGNPLEQVAKTLAELPKTVRAEIDNALDERLKVTDPANPPAPAPGDPPAPAPAPTPPEEPPHKKSFAERLGF